jgi:hypothetical protein
MAANGILRKATFDLPGAFPFVRPVLFVAHVIFSQALGHHHTLDPNA